MKKRLLLPLLLALAGCEPSSLSKKAAIDNAKREKAEAADQAALISYRKEYAAAPTLPLTEKDAALGLKFNTDRIVVQTKLALMGKSNKVYLKNVGGQTGAFYILNYLDGSHHEALIGFDWFGDRLSGMSFSILDGGCEDSTKRALVALYTQKFGAPTCSYQDTSKFVQHTVWLKGGRQIDISCDGSIPVISYSAVGMMGLKAKADAKEKADRPAKTLQDL